MIEDVARSGMATVYKAYRTALARSVTMGEAFGWFAPPTFDQGAAHRGQAE